MKKLKCVILFIFIVVLTACGKEDTAPETNQENQLEMIEVELIVPEKADIGEEVTFQANITQGGKEVEDADAVKFEISNKDGNEENSEMISYTKQDGGSYSISYAFKEDGIYVVQVHVDARSMHVMPKKEIQVGELSAYEHAHEDSGEDHSHSHSHHEETDIVVHLNENEYTSGQESVIKVHLSKGDSPYTEADVRFEIYKSGAEQHDWVEAEEASPGEYSTTHIFESSGKYIIKTHVEHSDGTHIHSDEEVEVQ